jgi:hypothetical protein
MEFIDDGKTQLILQGEASYRKLSKLKPKYRDPISAILLCRMHDRMD